MPWDRDLKDFGRKFRAENDFIMFEATRRLFNAVIRRSPVAEGEFVSEFDIGVNKVPRDVKREHLGPRAKTAARKRFAQELAKVDFGDFVILDNHDPAATGIEFGQLSPRKAPQGVIRVSAKSWRRFVRGAAAAAKNKAAKNLRRERAGIV